MKLLKISIVRSIAAAVVGVLLLKYDTAVLHGLTIALGIMFLLAGAVSLIGWVSQRRKHPSFQAYDNDGDEQAKIVETAQPMFPIVGLGSVLLGLILSLTQTADFLEWAMYLIGGVLVLGGLNLMMNLLAARKMEPVAFWMWLMPLLLIIASILAMIKGLVPPTTTTIILGVTALVYAVVELVYSIIFAGIRKRYEKTQAQVRRASEMQAEAEEGQVVVTDA